MDVFLSVLGAPLSPGSLGALAAVQFRRSFGHCLRVACDNDFSERRDTTVIQTIHVTCRRPPYGLIYLPPSPCVSDSE